MLSHAFGNSMTSAGIIFSQVAEFSQDSGRRASTIPHRPSDFGQAPPPRDLIVVLAGHRAIEGKDLKRGHVPTARTGLST